MGHSDGILNELVSGKVFRKRYGGRLPFLTYYYEKVICFFGAYGREKRVKWCDVRRLVFVCKGNINRSAYAENYCRLLYGNVASTGLDAKTGEPASDQAKLNATVRLISLKEHSTVAFADFEFRLGDLIIAFQPSQVKALEMREIVPGVQITLIGLWANGISPYIQDPVCREDEYFQSCFSRIERGVIGILDHIPPVKKH